MQKRTWTWLSRALIGSLAVSGLAGCRGAGSPAPLAIQGQENAVLTDAPNVPPPITRHTPPRSS